MKLARRIAVVLVLLLGPEASAQVAAGQSARIVPTQSEMAAQATFETSSLLALYMTQLAAAGTAPNQADIDKAARQYFTNGAAVTSVPTSGPGAAYFHDGAEVLAYYPAPQVTPAPDATRELGAGLVRSESYEEDAGVGHAVARTGAAEPIGAAAAPPAPTSEVGAGPSAATGLTCSPREIEAAMAIAREFATAAGPPPAATPCVPPPALVLAPLPAETAAGSAIEPAPHCPPGPSLLSRIALALGGAIFGGLAVALCWRPRLLRAAQRR